MRVTGWRPILVTHAIALLALVGCGSSWTAEYRARHLDAEAELARSRGQVAAQLAADAERSLEQGQEGEALRWAVMAAHFDPQYQPLEDEARRRIANIHLQEAKAALDKDQYSIARTQVNRALDLLPDLPEALATNDLIDQREAVLYLEQAESLAGAGDFHAALQTLARAERIDSGNPDIAAARLAITQVNREERFERIAAEFERLLADGRLREADARLSSLALLDLHPVQRQDMHDRWEARAKEADDLFEIGSTAQRIGDYTRALNDLTRAASLNRDLDLEREIQYARFGLVRDEFLAAMESGDRLGALTAARKMAELRGAPEIIRLVTQITADLIEQTRAAASDLTAQGKKDEAAALIRSVLEHVESPKLEDLLKEMESGGAEDSASPADAAKGADQSEV